MILEGLGVLMKVSEYLAACSDMGASDKARLLAEIRRLVKLAGAKEAVE